MPKANKHAEVKPSKFKTTLCSFYMAEKECPFGAKCAFAHGDDELLHEDDNIVLLKKTGLQRLEPLFESGAAAAVTVTDADRSQHENIISSTSDVASATSENYAAPAAAATSAPAAPAPQRQIVASLPTSPSHYGQQPNSLNFPLLPHPHSPTTNNSSFAFGRSNNASLSQAPQPLKRRPVMVSLPKQNTTSEQIHSPYAAAYQADAHVTQFSYNNEQQQQQQQDAHYYPYAHYQQQQPQQQQYYDGNTGNSGNVSIRSTVTATTPIRRTHQPYGQAVLHQQHQHQHQPRGSHAQYGYYTAQQQQQQQGENYNQEESHFNNNNNNNFNNNNKCHIGISSTCKKEQPLVYRHNPYRFS